MQSSVVVFCLLSSIFEVCRLQKLEKERLKEAAGENLDKEEKKKKKK